MTFILNSKETNLIEGFRGRGKSDIRKQIDERDQGRNQEAIESTGRKR